MIIGVDLDGVIYDFVTAAQDCAREMGAGNMPDPTCWSFPVVDWFMSWDTWAQFVSHATLGYKLFHRSRMSTATSRHLWELVEAGHELHYVTHRFPLGKAAQEAAYWQTEEWLNTAPGMLHIVEHASEKPDVAAKLKVDLFIEDNAENASALSQSGIRCDLVRRPWNAHSNTHITHRDFGAFTRHVLAAEDAALVVPTVDHAENLRNVFGAWAA